jgi:hypothetical protein
VRQVVQTVHLDRFAVDERRDFGLRERTELDLDQREVLGADLLLELADQLLLALLVALDDLLRAFLVRVALEDLLDAGPHVDDQVLHVAPQLLPLSGGQQDRHRHVGLPEVVHVDDIRGDLAHHLLGVEEVFDRRRAPGPVPQTKCCIPCSVPAARLDRFDRPLVRSSQRGSPLVPYGSGRAAIR